MSLFSQIFDLHSSATARFQRGQPSPDKKLCIDICNRIRTPYHAFDVSSVCSNVSSLVDWRKHSVLLCHNEKGDMDNEDERSSQGIVFLFPSPGCDLQAPTEGQDQG